MARQMASAALEPFGVQTKHASALLDLFKDVLLQDAAYVARLKRHYQEACPGRASGVVTVARTWGLTPAEKRRRREARRRGR